MSNDYIVINDDLRTMQIPSSIVLLGVESDDDVNRIPFQMPKEYCGFDLSTFDARINYMNANGLGDVYVVDDLEIDGDDPSLMNFSWLVGRNACAYKGTTKFIVCLKKFDANQNVVQEFNTTVYSLPVLEGLETTQAVVQQNADIIEYILHAIEDAGSIDLSNYYTKAEVDALKLPNPFALNINGTEYDGSEAVEITVEGGSSASTATASGTIIHLDDAVAHSAVKNLTLQNANGDVISSANVVVTNKNLFRLDQIATQTVSKGITFTKNDDGSIQASGTSTGTYAAAQCTLDKNIFQVGNTYTISSGKTKGVLYVQLILNYTDGTTDYLVSSNSPHTFTLAKPVSSASASVQITASGVTVNNEVILPMIELSDTASAFVNNVYHSMTYDGTVMPTLPASVCNIWSNNDLVNNIVVDYAQDATMARIDEFQNIIDNFAMHDGEMSGTSTNAVQNKVVTAAVNDKANSITKNVSGTWLTIDDGAENVPVKELIVNLEPKQSGSGDPSPTNVRPISGYDGVKVVRSGMNLLLLTPKTVTTNGVTATVNDNGTISLTGTATVDGFVVLQENISLAKGEYCLKEFTAQGVSDYTGTRSQVIQFRPDNYITIQWNSLNDYAVGNLTGGDGYIYRIRVKSGVNYDGVVITPMLTVGSEIHATFEPYNDSDVYSITFPSNVGIVYGGTLNVTTGVLTVEKVYRVVDSQTVLYKSSRYQGSFYFNMHYYGYDDLNTGVGTLLCSHAKFIGKPNETDYVYGTCALDGSANLFLGQPSTTLEQFKIWLDEEKNNGTPVTVVCKLMTPRTYQLTPTEVTTLLGKNIILSDCDMELNYRVDTNIMLEKIVSAIISLGGNI